MKNQFFGRFVLVSGAILAILSLPGISRAQSSGVQYTFDDYGIQSLTYNGQNYLSTIYGVPSNNSQVVATILFEAPDGTQKPYGWLANAIDPNLSIGTSEHTTGASPDFTKQIYRTGKEDSFTINWNYSAPDNRTLKVDLAVTNNDPTDTLKKIALEYFYSLTVPKPITTEIPYPGANLAMGSGPRDTPTAFLHGPWGSVIVFTDNYSSHWELGSATNNYASSPNEASFLMIIRNETIVDGDPSNATSNPIAPGQTAHYVFYIRFGSATDATNALAPEAYSAFRNSVPYLVNWQDRRPIARWFIGKGADYGSATNPRSYLWDPAINVFDQSDFTTRVLAATDSTIGVMNAMNPKPQGIVFWDLEGDEFFQYFTYVGYPNKLHDLAPEMDAVADQMFQKFKDAGYKVGMTLRPGDFQTGPLASRPSTCFSSATNVDLDDIYIATDGTYPNRGYTCTATNTWTNNNAHHPYHQHSPQDDATLFRNLESKVAYARSRWGAKLFYVDSTVYSGNGGGNSFNYTIFRRLQQEFPDVIFFPENASLNYWGASAVYMDTHPGASVSGVNTPTEVKHIYPQAFSMIEPLGSDLTDPTIHSNLVQAVRDGNMLFVDGWWPNPMNAEVQRIYQEAGISNGGGSDTVAPSASITAPVSNASLSGTVSITVSASDNTAVTRVELLKDGALLATLNNSPYTYSWDTNSATNAVHALIAKAYDAAGNVGTSATVNVTVSNVVNTQYTLTLTKAGTGVGTVTGGSINCGATCTQTANSGTAINLTAAPASGSTFTSWSVAPTASGNCSAAVTCNITLTANTTVTATFTASVPLNPDVTPPTVSITSPSSNSTVSGTQVALTAVANDPVSPSDQATSGLAGVQFKVDGNNLGSEQTSGFSGYWDTTAISNGSHSLTAVARDAAGNRTTSATIVVTVNNVPVETLSPDTTPPTAPTGVTATAVSPYQVNISWNPSTDPAGPSGQVPPSGIVSYKIYVNGAALTTVSGNSYSHSGLTPRTAYGYSLVAYDGAGNSSIMSTTVAATTPAVEAQAPTPLIISNGAPWSIFPPGTKTAKLSLVTNRLAICEYTRNLNSSYGLGTKFVTTHALSHETTLSGLQDGSVNTYYIHCRDDDGTESLGNYIISFSVAKSVVANRPVGATPSQKSTGTFTPLHSTAKKSVTKPSSTGTGTANNIAANGVQRIIIGTQLSTWEWLISYITEYNHLILPVIGI